MAIKAFVWWGQGAGYTDPTVTEYPAYFTPHFILVDNNNGAVHPEWGHGTVVVPLYYNTTQASIRADFKDELENQLGESVTIIWLDDRGIL